MTRKCVYSTLMNEYRNQSITKKKIVTIVTQHTTMEYTTASCTFIFLKRFGMFSSSNGKLPQRSAYKITPQLQTSTSGPAYNLPEITCQNVASMLLPDIQACFNAK